MALAAFAAASIAKASPMRIGWKATHIAIAGLVTPYMAMYDPALMFQGGTLRDTVYVVVKAVIAIVLWGGASIGYLPAPLNWPERIVATAAAFLLVVAIPWTDEAGFALGVALVLWHWPRTRRVRGQPPAEAVDAACFLVWRPRNNWTTHCFAFLRRGRVDPG